MGTPRSRSLVKPGVVGSGSFRRTYEPQRMLEVVQEQLRTAEQAFAERAERMRVQQRLAHLTPREREVLLLVIEGKSSQQIASRLGTSVKTVDVHRARIKVPKPTPKAWARWSAMSSPTG